MASPLVKAVVSAAERLRKESDGQSQVASLRFVATSLVELMIKESPQAHLNDVIRLLSVYVNEEKSHSSIYIPLGLLHAVPAILQRFEKSSISQLDSLMKSLALSIRKLMSKNYEVIHPDVVEAALKAAAVSQHVRLPIETEMLTELGTHFLKSKEKKANNPCSSLSTVCLLTRRLLEDSVEERSSKIARKSTGAISTKSLSSQILSLTISALTRDLPVPIASTLVTQIIPAIGGSVQILDEIRKLWFAEKESRIESEKLKKFGKKNKKRKRNKGKGGGRRTWLCFACVCQIYGRLEEKTLVQSDEWMLDMCRIGLESTDPIIRKRALFLLKARVARRSEEKLSSDILSHGKMWMGYIEAFEVLDEHGLHLVSSVWDRPSTWESLRHPSMYPWIQTLLQTAMTHKNQSVRRYSISSFTAQILPSKTIEAEKKSNTSMEIEESKDGVGVLQGVLSQEFLCGPFMEYLDNPGLYRIDSSKKMELLDNCMSLIHFRLASANIQSARSLFLNILKASASVMTSALGFASILRCLSKSLKFGAFQGDCGELMEFLDPVLEKCHGISDFRVRNTYYEVFMEIFVRQLELNNCDIPLLLAILYNIPRQYVAPGSAGFSSIRALFTTKMPQKGLDTWIEKALSDFLPNYLDGKTEKDVEKEIRHAWHVSTMLSMLSKDSKILQQASDTIAKVLQTCFSQPYSSPIAKLRAILMLPVVFSLSPSSDSSSPYLGGLVLKRFLKKSMHLWRDEVQSLALSCLEFSRNSPEDPQNLLKSPRLIPELCKVLTLSSSEEKNVFKIKKVVNECLSELKKNNEKKNTQTKRKVNEDREYSLIRLFPLLECSIMRLSSLGSSLDKKEKDVSFIIKEILSFWEKGDTEEKVITAGWMWSVLLRTLSFMNGLDIETTVLDRVWDASLDTIFQKYTGVISRGDIGGRAVCTGENPQQVGAIVFQCLELLIQQWSYLERKREISCKVDYEKKEEWVSDTEKIKPLLHVIGKPFQDARIRKNKTTVRAYSNLVTAQKLFSDAANHGYVDKKTPKPLTGVILELLSLSLNPGRSAVLTTVIVTPIFSKAIADTADIPGIFEHYLEPFGNMLTAYEKEDRFPPAMISRLKTIFDSHMVHLIPDSAVSKFEPPQFLDGDIGISGSPICRAVSLLAVNSILSPKKLEKSRQEFLEMLIRHLIKLNDYKSISSTKRGKITFADSPEALRAMYLWISICCVSRHLYKATKNRENLIKDVLNHAWESLDYAHTPTIRHLVEVLIVSLLLQNPDQITKTLIPRLRNPSRRPTVTASNILVSGFVILAYMTNSVSNSFEGVGVAKKKTLKTLWLDTVPYLSSNYGQLRVITQFIFFKVYPLFSSQKDESMQDFKENEEPLKRIYKLLSEGKEYETLFKKMGRYFEKYNPLEEIKIEGMLNMMKTSPVFHDRIPAEIADNLKSVVTSTLTGIRLHYDDEWITYQNQSANLPKISAEKKLIDSKNWEQLSNFQQKIKPLSELYAEVESSGTSTSRDVIKEAWSKKKRQSIIIIASLVNKAPNLGGLTRTCEIFNVESLAISDLRLKNTQIFKSLAVTADKWMPLSQVPPQELPNYIRKLKTKGYRILALEQAAHSRRLQEYEFPKKVAVLLGREKEGVPAELLNLVDDCIEIPQLGMIRSLNVHVSGSLLVWEYTRQQILRESKGC